MNKTSATFLIKLRNIGLRTTYISWPVNAVGYKGTKTEIR
jgi:hypothetical protein